MENDLQEAFDTRYLEFLQRTRRIGVYDVYTEDNSVPMLPLHVHWSKVNVVSYFLSRPLDEATEPLLQILIRMNKPINSEFRCVPALTAILSHAGNKKNYERVVVISQYLLNNGADPSYISRNSCVRPETVPDALLLAAFKKCWPAVQILLPYWWPSPVYLLDSWVGNHTEQFEYWFPKLIKYGWPHGSLISNIMEDYVLLMQFKKNTFKWATFLDTLRQPCSLKQLCRIEVRKCVGTATQSEQGTPQQFMNRLTQLGLPLTLVDYLLLKII